MARDPDAVPSRRALGIRPTNAVSRSVKATRLVRTALARYEKALAAIEELKAKGPLPTGTGATIFIAGGYDSDRWTCSECGRQHYGSSIQEEWKYCPRCGCEILRFNKPPKPQDEGTDLTLVPVEPVAKFT